MSINYNRVIKMIAALGVIFHAYGDAKPQKKPKIAVLKVKPEIKETVETKPAQESNENPQDNQAQQDMYEDTILPFGLNSQMDNPPQDVAEAISFIKKTIIKHSIVPIKINSMILNFLNQQREMTFRSLIPKDLMAKISEMMSNQNQNVSEEDAKELRDQIQDAFRNNMNKYPELSDIENTLQECFGYLLKLPQVELDYGNSYHYCRMSKKANKALRANVTRVCTWISTVLSGKLVEYVAKINPESDSNPNEAPISESDEEVNPNE